MTSHTVEVDGQNASVTGKLLRQALQRCFRFLRQAGFGCSLSKGFQQLAGARRAYVLQHFHGTVCLQGLVSSWCNLNESLFQFVKPRIPGQRITEQVTEVQS
jgi:hypothetical protein